MWIATCEDGSTHEEKWVEDELSPWNRLINYCKKNKTYLTGLRMGQFNLPRNKPGYWYAKSLRMTQGGYDEDQTGIGYVDGDKLYILWVFNGGTSTYVEHRSIEGQNQIIWAPKQINSKLI